MKLTNLPQVRNLREVLQEVLRRWYPQRTQQVGLLLVILLGLTLRLYDLGRGTVWADEAAEYWVASASTGEVFQAVSEEIHDPPLYSFILHFWMSGGITGGYLRLPSVIFSMLTLFGVMAAAYQLNGAWSSLLAGLLLAVSPVDIRYAQEIGQYSLYACLGIWSANCFLLLQKAQADWKAHAAWLASSLGAVYSHYGAVFPIAAMFLVEAWMSISGRSWKRLKQLAIAAFVLLVGILPLLLFILPIQLTWVHLPGFSSLSLTTPVKFLLDLLVLLSHTFSFLYSAWPYTHIPEWLPNLLAACTIAIPLLLFKRISRAMRLWTAWLLVSICIYLPVVHVGLFPPGFRQSMFLLVALIPLMAAICLHLKDSRPTGPVVAVLLTGTYLAISLVNLPNISLRNLIYLQEEWTWPETNYEIRPTIDYWWQQRESNEPIYVYYGGNRVFRYYLRVLDRENTWLPYNWNRDEKYHRATQPLNVAYGKWLRERPAEELSGDVLEALPAEAGAFWILFVHVHGNEDEQMMEGLLKTYEVDDQKEARGSTLYHLMPRQ